MKKREFRFRVWNPRTKEMITPDRIRNQEIPTDPTKVGFKLRSQFILMQAVDMKDLRGVDIYEGDILRAECPFTHQIHQVKVEYDNHMMAYWMLDTVTGDPIGISDFEDLDDKMHLTVIGNIYEGVKS
jgi:uncharacterized phage protein (TIGR01671 family)